MVMLVECIVAAPSSSRCRWSSCMGWGTPPHSEGSWRCRCVKTSHPRCRWLPRLLFSSPGSSRAERWGTAWSPPCQDPRWSELSCCRHPSPAQQIWTMKNIFCFNKNIFIQYSYHLPSPVVSIPLRSACTLKLAIIVPSLRRNARMVFLPLW